MGLVKKPFVRMHEDKKGDTFNVRLSPKERLEFDKAKYLVQQEKDSTAIKDLARIGAKVLQEEKTKMILDVVLNNYRKNKSGGIVTFD